MSYLLVRDFDTEAFRAIAWTWNSTLWLAVTILMAAVRDLAYMWRIRTLTERALDWKRCFYVTFLWEFASALVPPVLGGGFAFAILFLMGERIPGGKSIAIVMVTSLLDGLFFAVMAPLVVLFIGKSGLFSGINPENIATISYGRELFVAFWIIYGIILLYKLVVVYAVFINARAVKWLLIKICALPLMKRWKYRAAQTGTEMVIASHELKHKTIRFWTDSIISTFLSWTARFIIINSLIMAFSDISVSHLLLYGRQVVMGILMIGSPTPGGSGVAELVFSNFLNEFIPVGLVASLALFWRLIAYYAYLFIGVVLLPAWLKRVLPFTHLHEDKLNGKSGHVMRDTTTGGIFQK
ncbi:MAG: flippase-like domain-containing protein [Bacteroidetes bacterium]|nr:flippase-like domain-containing protein [Bacteroidota bacterium]